MRKPTTTTTKKTTKKTTTRTSVRRPKGRFTPSPYSRLLDAVNAIENLYVQDFENPDFVEEMDEEDLAFFRQELTTAMQYLSSMLADVR